MRTTDVFDKAELWNKETIAKTQLVRLRTSVERASRSAFYSEQLTKAGFKLEQLQSLDDLRRIPFTTKDDLRNSYPLGTVAVPQSELVRLHASSGTTGTPTVICHTQADLNSWADLMARCMYMVGVRKTDVFQNMAGYGLFTGGLGIHYGAERVGCLTIPAGAGNTRRQLKLVNDIGTTVAHIIPSYAMYLGATLREMNIDPASLSLRIALIGAEPHTNETRCKIEQLLGIKAYNSYGLSEMNGPGVAFECMEQNGMHVWEDAYIAEIVNPETGEPVPDGEVGELVMTTLCRQGMPILRYRTRDLTRFLSGPCPCGREHRRIDRILGRSDDMLIVKGVNIYPMQIEQVLMGFPEVGENYLIVLEREEGRDEMLVKIELKPEAFVEDMRILHKLRDKLIHRMRDEVLVSPKIELVQANSLPKSEGKAQRVQDNRE